MTWLSSSARGVIWSLEWGALCACEERLKRRVRADIGQTPTSPKIGVVDCCLFFCGRCNTGDQNTWYSIFVTCASQKNVTLCIVPGIYWNSLTRAQHTEYLVPRILLVLVRYTINTAVV